MTQGKIEKSRTENSFMKKQVRSIKSRQLRTTIAPFGISELNISPAEARPGELVVISFNATNTSDFSSIYPVTLKINDEVVAAEVVSLGRGTTMPMEFTIAKIEPGNYKVDVNNSTDAFTIIGNISKNEVAMNRVIKPDKSETEVSLDPRLLKLIVPVKQKELPAKYYSTGRGGLIYLIDRAADGIIFVLDKVGDMLIFPIVKLVGLFTTIFRTDKRRPKNRM